ncbi:MAG: hypothetical protein WCN95_15805 [bacterium]
MTAERKGKCFFRQPAVNHLQLILFTDMAEVIVNDPDVAKTGIEYLLADVYSQLCFLDWVLETPEGARTASEGIAEEVMYLASLVTGKTYCAAGTEVEAKVSEMAQRPKPFIAMAITRQSELMLVFRITLQFQN